MCPPVLTGEATSRQRIRVACSSPIRRAATHGPRLPIVSAFALVAVAASDGSSLPGTMLDCLNFACLACSQQRYHGNALLPPRPFLPLLRPPIRFSLQQAYRIGKGTLARHWAVDATLNCKERLSLRHHTTTTTTTRSPSFNHDIYALLRPADLCVTETSPTSKVTAATTTTAIIRLPHFAY